MSRAADATLNYATQYQQGLQIAYSENGNFYSRALWNSPSNGLVNFVGARTIKVPRLRIKDGRRDRTRRNGDFGFGANYENTWDIYELQNEREWGTLVDPSDVDETNFVTSMANITRVFNDTQKIPEMDKQMFSTLFQKKQTLNDGGIATRAITEANVLIEFDRMMFEMDEAEVPREGRVLYVTPTVERVLKNAQGLTRNINVTANNGVIDRAVQRLDDVQIVPVISDRFRTLYNFTNGAIADPTSRQIQMMLIHVPCMIAPQKYSFVGLDAPSASSAGNWKYYEQAYDDVLLLEHRTDGIQFIISP